MGGSCNAPKEWGPEARLKTADICYAMTYAEIFELKFKKGYGTTQLLESFPKEASKVSQIALLQIPTPILKETVTDRQLLEKLLRLKKRFLEADSEF